MIFSKKTQFRKQKAPTIVLILKTPQNCHELKCFWKSKNVQAEALRRAVIKDLLCPFGNRTCCGSSDSFCLLWSAWHALLPADRPTFPSHTSSKLLCQTALRQLFSCKLFFAGAAFGQVACVKRALLSQRFVSCVCIGLLWVRHHFVVVIGESAEQLLRANYEKGNAW